MEKPKDSANPLLDDAVKAFKDKLSKTGSHLSNDPLKVRKNENKWETFLKKNLNHR